MSELSDGLNSNVALDLENFPIDVFPSEIQTIIKELDRVYGFTNELVSASMIYTISVAIGNSHYVGVKSGWTDSASLYIVLIGTAGSGKTHALKWCIEPLQKYDAKFKKVYDDELLRFKRDEGLERPNPKQILIQDITLESLYNVLQNNPRGMGIYVDELGTWIKKFDQYRGGGGDKESWLSIWSNTPITVNRKTNNEFTRIETPFISVIGGVQKETFNEYLYGNQDNGFSDRLFMVNTKGSYTAYNTEEFSANYKSQWGKVIDTIISYPLNFDTNGNVLPHVLPLSKEAVMSLLEWDKENEEKVNTGKADEQLVPKAKTHAFRFSLIIEILYCSVHNIEPKQISVQSINKGIRLAEYYISQQLDVRLFAKSSPVDKLNMKKRKMYDLLPEGFTTKMAYESLESFGCKKTISTFIRTKELFHNVDRGLYKKV
jgi:hypothetical protein